MSQKYHLLILLKVETNYDYLRLYDGNTSNANLLAELTGYSLPPNVWSCGNQMLAAFSSDGSVTRAGYYAKITVSDGNCSSLGMQSKTNLQALEVSSTSFAPMICPKYASIGNGICDEANNKPVCHFDGGDCYCDFNNFTRDGLCNQANNKSFCLFDHNDCYECHNSSLIDNGECNQENFNQACMFDGDDCKGCVMWRQTGSCDPNGPREPQYDKACDVVVESGWSGFCECKFGNAMLKGCESSSISTCNEACEFETTPSDTTVEHVCPEYALIGNGICDPANKNFACQFDGGDCTSLGGTSTNCTSLECIEDLFFDPCPNYALIGNGQCDAENFNLICSYDGGDCQIG